MPDKLIPYTDSPSLPADKKAKLEGLVSKLKSEGYHPDDINLLVKTAEKKFGQPLLGKGQDVPISKPIDNTPKPEVSQVKDMANFQAPKVDNVKTALPKPDNQFIAEPERITPKTGFKAVKEDDEKLARYSVETAIAEGNQKAEQYFSGNNLKEKKLDRFGSYEQQIADTYLPPEVKDIFNAAKDVEYKQKFTEFDKGKSDSKAEDRYASLMKKRTLDIDNEIRNLQSIVERGYTEENGPVIGGMPVPIKKPLSEQDKAMYQQKIKELNGQKGWFFEPQKKVEEVAQQYSNQIAKLPDIDDDTTPLEALKMLYLDKFDAFNKLKDELGYDNKAIYALSQLKGIITSNPKEKLFRELHQELQALAPIALLNLPPQQKKEGFLKVTAQSFIKNTFTNGLIPPNTPETNQAIVKAIEEAKIKKEEVNSEIWKNIESNPTYKSWSAQGAADMLGNSLSYFMPVSVSSKLMGVTKAGKGLMALAQSGRLASTGRIATQINKLPVGINKLVFGVTQQGLLFETAGTLFSRGDELNTATGVAGSIGEQSANKLLESFSKVFGKQAPAVVKYVSALFGKGFAETSQEFGEETVQTIQQMDNGKFLPTVVKMFQDGEVYQEFKKNMSQKFPDLSETGWFAVNTFVMGMVFGLGSVKYEEFKKQVVESVPENERETVLAAIEESEKEREEIGNQVIKEQVKENPQDKVLQEFSDVNDELLAINEEIKNEDDPARLQELEAEKGQLESKQAEIINRMNEESSNVEEVEEEIPAEEVLEELPGEEVVEEGAAPNPKTATVDEVVSHRINVAQKEIESDIAEGIIPEGVTSFEELHDFVDANMYVNDADRGSDNVFGPVGKREGWKDSDFYFHTNRMLDAINKWLANGRKGSAVDYLTTETNIQTQQTVDSEENSGSQLIKRPETKPIDDAEILDIVKNKKVSPERLNEIADKVDTGAELSPREKRVADMFAEDIKKINSPKKVKAIKEVGEVSDEEIIKFIDNNEVSDQRKQNIAYKKANDLELSPMEDDIYAQNKKEIDKFTKENTWLKDETANTSNRKDTSTEEPDKTGGKTDVSKGKEKGKRISRKGTKKSDQKIKDPEQLKALEREPSDEFDYVMQALIGGAKLTRKAVSEIFTRQVGGEKRLVHKEIQSRLSLQNNTTGYETIRRFAHSLWENQKAVFGYNKYSDKELSDAVERVLLDNNSPSSIATSLNNKYKSSNNTSDDGSRENESGEREYYVVGIGWITEEEMNAQIEAEANEQGISDEEYMVVEKALSDEEKAEILEYADTLSDEEVEQLLKQNQEAFESIEAEIDYQAEEETITSKPIGVDNQIEDVLEGEGDEQKKEVQKKIKFAKENTDKIVSINGKKVYDVSIDEENNLRYNLRKKGELTNQNYYYPVQYAQIEYSTEETKQPNLQDELSQLQQEISDAKSNLEKAEKSLDKDLKANQGDMFAGGGQQTQLINDSADKKKEVDNRKKKLDSLLEKEKELKSRIEDNLPGQTKLEIQEKPKTQAGSALEVGVETTAKEFNIGDEIIWEGKKTIILSKVKMGKEWKYNIELPDGKNVWTNYNAIQSEKSKNDFKKITEFEVGDTITDTTGVDYKVLSINNKEANLKNLSDTAMPGRTDVFPIETVARFKSKEQKPVAYKGNVVSQMAVSMGSDQGGISDFTADRIAQEDYVNEEIKIEDLIESDKDLAEYIESVTENDEEPREFDGPPNQMPIIVTSKGEVIDGYNRIHQAIVNGEDKIDAYRGVPKKENAAKPNKKVERKIRDEKVKKDIDDALNDFLKASGDLTMGGLSPEKIEKGVKLINLYAKAGIYKFSDIIEDLYAKMGDKVKDIFNDLKGVYAAYYTTAEDNIADQMDSNVRNVKYEDIVAPFQENNEIEEQNNKEDVLNRSTDSQRDSEASTDALSENEEAVQSDRTRSRLNRSRNEEGGFVPNKGQTSSEGYSDTFSPPVRKPSNIELYPNNGELFPIEPSTGVVDGRGSSVTGRKGVSSITEPGQKTDSGTGKATFEQKLEQQKKAESTEVKVGDINNIAETLPFLFSEQHQDVLKAEERFFSDKHKTKELANGKGYMFTNATGTGKTFTGLGIAKRFAKQGKGNILIVTPSQNKVDDWVHDAKKLGMKATPIPDTKTGGDGMVVTTFANFRANKGLKERDFDLVIYDESHRLMESKSGDVSNTTSTHYENSNKDENSALQRLKSVHPLWEKENNLYDKLKEAEKQYKKSNDPTDKKLVEDIQSKINTVKEEQAKVLPQMKERAKRAAENTKVVFLSATPFKAHFNLRYANGFLFDWGTDGMTNSRGSRIDAESLFYLQKFGSAYEWKYHRLQTRERANPDAIAMQEVQFANELSSKGLMSGRMINSDMDYSREFPLPSDFDSSKFNRAYNDIFNYQERKYDSLQEVAKTVFNDYNYSTKLFEALKASISIPRVKEHIALGRKVVVFHRRKQAEVTPPFQTIVEETKIKAQLTLNDENSSQDMKEKASLSLDQIDEFVREHQDVLEYEQTLNYNSAIEQFTAEFGDRVRFINGDISTKNKISAVKDFNDDKSNIDVIVIQEESGKEGISLHDTTGSRQRVLVNLSMPISTITALQIEGRVYRLGQKTNAIFEYPLLGLDSETAYFGQNLNRRLGTTENLAMGDMARDLIRSFSEGVLFNATSDKPSMEQGAGGKEFDKKAEISHTPFQKAILVYDSNQKTRGRRDQREGVDYYPTPEPLGFKMVEWLNLQEGNSVLEPSAGHGSIAMWVPSLNNITAIEPSFQLYSKLTARAGGGDRKIFNQTFEDFNIINKFEGVAMNPPFGNGGKAMDHVEKAFKHLKNNGRIVAIIPAGSNALKRLDAFLNGVDEKGRRLNPDAHLKAVIELPSVTFEQATTSVNTQIIVIDKIHGLEESPKVVKHDLKDVKSIKDLFNKIEDLSVPERPQEKIQQYEDDTLKPAEPQKILDEPFETKHTKTNESLFIVKPAMYLGDDYNRVKDVAVKYGGYYSSYATVRGFVFKTKESADKFFNEINNTKASENKSPELQKTDKKFTSIPKKAYNNLVVRLKKAFPNIQIFGDYEQLKQKLKEYGISATDFLFGYENNPNLSEQNAKELLKAQALQVQGVSNKEIREKTGWFVGLDGKWKYLIDDTNARFIISEKEMRERSTGEKPDFNKGIPFNQVFEHSDLLKNYPKFVDNLKVVFYENSDKDVGGGYRFDSETGQGTIYLNVNYEGGDVATTPGEARDLREVLIHEVQHRTQHYHTGDSGTNAGYIKELLDRGLLKIFTPNNKEYDYSNVDKNKLAEYLYKRQHNEIEARAAVNNNDLRGVADVLKSGFYFVEDMREPHTYRLQDLKNIDFLRTKDGEIYGALFPDGSMYLDPTKINANTPIHEFGHVWVNYIEKANRELFNKGISLISDSKYVEEVKSNPAYSGKSKPEILKEALVTAIGDKGEMLNKTQLDRFMEWLQRLFTDVKRMFGDTGIRTIKAKEVQNLGLEQFLTGAVRDITGGKEIKAEAPKGVQLMSLPDGRKVQVKSVNADVVNGFYSPLEKTINETKFDKLPAKQWLEKFAKGEEAKWTGLNEWLGKQQGSVSKADIQNYLKDNRIEIVEVVKGVGSNENRQKEIEKIFKDKGYELETDMGGEGSYLVDSDGDIVEDNDMDILLDEYNSISDGNFNSNSQQEGKFSQYQLDGERENYKEILVTLPETQGREVETMYDDFGNPTTNPAFKPNTVKSKGVFKSPHFDEPNILVHLRMNTRTDVEGNKVLFLEEVQSDWGQKGKKEGFRQDDLKLTAKKASGDNRFDVYQGDRLIRAAVFAQNAERAIAYIESNPNEFGTNSLKTPTAPFVTDTNAWTKLGLKAALKEAVKQGADKIAWTTGEQQNDRYDLSKQVQSISVNKEGNERGVSIQIDAQKPSINLVLNESGNVVYEYNETNESFIGKNIEDIAGREVAQKIMGVETEKKFKGNDLKVGGKGMKGFYGSPTEASLGIVGNVAKSLFKQEPKTLEINQGTKRTVEKWNHLTEEMEFIEYEVRSDKKSTQHSIDITPELKAQVSEGLPMFQLQQEPKDVKLSNKAIQTIFEQFVTEHRDALENVLFNWEDVRLEVDEFNGIVDSVKLKGNAGRDSFFGSGENSAPYTPSKKEFIKWLLSEAPLGNEYTVDKEWKNNIKDLRDIVNNNLKKDEPGLNKSTGAELKEAKDQLKEALKEWWQSSKNMGIISDPEENARQDLKLFKALLNYAKVYIQANANATLEEFKKQIPVMFQRLNQDLIQDAFLQKEKTLADLLNKKLAFVPKKPKEVEKTLVKKRVYDGDFREEVKILLEDIGLTRNVASQQEAESKAQKFIDSIGIDAALDAVRNGDIKNGDIEAAIYFLSIDKLDKQINTSTDETEISELISKQTKLIEELGLQQTRAGQFSAIANRFYQMSDLGYKSEVQANNWEREFGSKPPAELMEKWKARDKELEELRKKLQEAEQRAIEAEEKTAVESIVESVEEEKKKAKPRIYGKTRIARGVDDLASALGIRLAAVGDERPKVINALADIGQGLIEEGLATTKNVAQKIREYLDKNFKGKLDFDEYEKDVLFKITGVNVNDKGVKVPHSLIRKLVADGIDNIDDLTKAVHEVLLQADPSITEREVRDAITGYGKVVFPSKDEIEKSIRKMKRIGRIYSALEDVAKKKRPLRSGRQRDALEADERRLLTQLREEMKDLPEDEETQANQLRTRLDAAKKRIQNQIDDLQSEIDKKEAIKRNVKKVEDDAELKGLKEKRDELKKKRDAIINDEATVEAKRLLDAKKRVQQRIDDLQRRLREKDFSKKETKPVIADSELVKLQAEKIRLKDEYDKEFYKEKLRNRSQQEKIKDILWELWGVPRLLMATGEWSFVGIQGLVQTISHPTHAVKAFRNAWKAMLSEEKTEQWLREIKSHDWYPVLKESKLSLTEPNAELTAREELFYSGWTNFIWNGLGQALMLPTMVKGKESYKNAVDTWNKINPIKAVERASIGYLDTLRVLRFLDGMYMLEIQGKDFQNNKQDYKDVADAINTMTGRASLGKLEPNAPMLSKIFFSPRNWASGIKSATPYALIHFGTMTPTARKIAIADFSKFLGLTTSMVMLAANALKEDDDDETSVEFDPRSSDFMKIKIGNIRVDPWGGRQQQVVLSARIIADAIMKGHALAGKELPLEGALKKADGKIYPLGVPFKTFTAFELGLQQATNKLNPTASLLYNYSNTKIQKGVLKDKFGNEYTLSDQFSDKYYPIFWGTAMELLKDDPTALDGLLTFYAFFGGGVMQYEDKKSK